MPFLEKGQGGTGGGAAGGKVTVLIKRKESVAALYELGIWASSLANSYPEPEGPGDGAGEAELTFALVVLQCLGGGFIGWGVHAACSSGPALPPRLSHQGDSLLCAQSSPRAVHLLWVSEPLGNYFFGLERAQAMGTEPRAWGHW